MRAKSRRRGAKNRHLSEWELRGKRMKAFYLQAILRGMALAGALAGGGAAIWAQAPPGPQPTSPGQENPAPGQKPAAPQQQKPQEAGGTVSVAMPVLMLDVVAATPNRDII